MADVFTINSPLSKICGLFNSIQTCFQVYK
nr:MAG TPA: hypothetical protein [Caudoviricetes sp.]